MSSTVQFTLVQFIWLPIIFSHNYSGKTFCRGKVMKFWLGEKNLLDKISPDTVQAFLSERCSLKACS